MRALTLSLLLLQAAVSAGWAQTPELDRRIAGFRADLVQLRERLGIPGLSVAIARDGELVWAEGLGYADVRDRRRARPDTPYRIASITKPLTATLLLRLAYEGRLDLDAPLVRYLEEGAGLPEEVTVRHVLTHTSEGEPPGLKYAYSGRYNRLAEAAAGAAGRPFAELLLERVLRPSGMYSTVPVSRTAVPPGPRNAEALARPYGSDGAIPAQSSLPPERTTGGNGVISTVLDLTRLPDALRHVPLVPPAMLEEMWTAARTPAGERLPYGLGWFVERTPALELVWHGGQWPVYSGLLLHLPEQGLTLAILANSPDVSRPSYNIGTGTALFSAFGASFLRHFALDDVYEGAPPELAWEADVDELAAAGAELPAGPRHYYGAELVARALVARAEGRSRRGDSLLAAVHACCRGSFAASSDLGLLFHLGKSGNPELRRLGQAAGERRLSRFPEDALTRFHLAVSYSQAGQVARAEPLLESLLAQEDRLPAWMWGWVAYMRAEQLMDDRPDRARALLRRVLERDVDESGLLAQARALLARLEGGSGG